ncbi:MAG: hypothetical protein KatS3mg002_0332 [Candidatus Woesearchaeota archaeon]|nr:MAG: hypothetical protein KatS3mg002_0332 [Candidatus Woesearchaeota archaeon]
MPTPQDRKVHKFILYLIENEAIPGPVGYDLIDFINRTAVERCKQCQYYKEYKEKQTKEDKDKK